MSCPRRQNHEGLGLDPRILPSLLASASLILWNHRGPQEEGWKVMTLLHKHLFFCFILNPPFFRVSSRCSIWKFPGLGVDSELQLPAYTTATATPDPS